MNNNHNHDCIANLDSNCICKICGEVHHKTVQEDDGTYSFSGKFDTIKCIRCGKKESFYSDTGSVIHSDFEDIRTEKSNEENSIKIDKECNHDFYEFDEYDIDGREVTGRGKKCRKCGYSEIDRSK